MIQWGHSYAVPRPSGELVIGATNEDVGFDRSLTPAGIGQLLSAVQQLSTVAASYPIQEMWAGFRPATPDGLPVLGRGRLPGLVYATGHYRNGILLAPITAAAVLAVIEDRPPVVPLEAFAPSRFEV
jgi:glycine/D-amino acid oxidase-like deaminating enzyme